MTDFYEDDEPLDAIKAAFADGEPAVTSGPVRGWNYRLDQDMHLAEVAPTLGAPLTVEYTGAIDRAGEGNLGELKRQIGRNLDPALLGDLLLAASEMVEQQRVVELDENDQP